MKFAEGRAEPGQARQTCSIMRACQIAGVSRRTIYNWMKAAKVEYLRTAGGSVRIYTDTLWRDLDGKPVGPVAAENEETRL